MIREGLVYNNTGWICPRCGASVSPSELTCPKCSTPFSYRLKSNENSSFTGDTNNEQLIFS